MPKKRVGVSLRKPSPAPERASGSAQVPVAALASAAPETVLRAAAEAAQPSAVTQVVVTEAAPLDALQAVALQAEAVSVEVLSLEAVAPVVAPTPAAAPLAAAMMSTVGESAPAATVEAFVNGAAATLENVASAMPAEKLEELLQRGPAGYREFTIYLPEKLADALSVFCREHELDLSQLVATAVEQHMSAAKAAVSAALSHESLLAVAARSLLGDLKGWVRSVLTTRRFRSTAAA
jgi:hypothetical protein